jgi:hypothetical protein
MWPGFGKLPDFAPILSQKQFQSLAREGRQWRLEQRLFKLPTLTFSIRYREFADSAQTKAEYSTTFFIR